MEIQSSRRKVAEKELGLATQREAAVLDRAISKEEERRERSRRKKEDLEMNSYSYRSVKFLSSCLDDYFIDPFLGLLFPVVGDMVTAVFTFPFIYVSLVKIKSIPLTLAVIHALLIDIFIGMFPFIGDVLDFFNKSFKKSHKLIVGFIEDDRDIIRTVNKKAAWMFISICIMCVVIYYLYIAVKSLIYLVWDFLVQIFDAIVGMF